MSEWLIKTRKPSESCRFRQKYDWPHFECRHIENKKGGLFCDPYYCPILAKTDGRKHMINIIERNVDCEYRILREGAIVHSCTLKGGNFDLDCRARTCPKYHSRIDLSQAKAWTHEPPRKVHVERKAKEHPGKIVYRDPDKTISDIAAEIAELVEEKQIAYGNSFNHSGEILKILYPDGVKPEEYADMLCTVRMIDKLFRIASQKEAFGENPYRDIVGYSLLGAKYL